MDLKLASTSELLEELSRRDYAKDSLKLVVTEDLVKEIADRVSAKDGAYYIACLYRDEIISNDENKVPYALIEMADASDGPSLQCLSRLVNKFKQIIKDR